MNCKHCYLGDRLDNHNIFSIQEIKTILKLFSDLPGRKDVTFLGGEPILYKKINSAIKIASDLGFLVRIDTNGYYSTDYLKKIDYRYINEICFSLDGSSAQIHNKIRKNGSYQKVISNIKYAKQENISDIKITHTIMKENINDIYNLINLLKKLEIRNLNLHLISHNGNAIANPDLFIEPEKWLNLVDKLWNVEGILIRFPISFLPKENIQYNTDLKREIFKCEISNLNRLSIFPDRKIYCCSLLFDTNLNVGYYNVDKNKLIMLENSEFSLQRKMKNCIAKDYSYNHKDFHTICRFIKDNNKEKKYREIFQDYFKY